MSSHELSRDGQGEELSNAPSSHASRIVRGAKVHDQGVVGGGSFELYGADPRSFALGSVLLPYQALFNNLLFLGSPGAGKTTLLNQVKRYVAELVEEGLGRMFIWDFKGEERRHLSPYTIEAPTYYVNPLLTHGVGIELAADVRTPFAATQLAMDMIAPEANEGAVGNGMEWVRASRSVFSHVIQAFQREAPGRWRFLDVLEACVTFKNLRRVLSMTRLGRARLEEMLGSQKQAAGVMLTLQGAAEDMWSLAEAMTKTKNISLEEWFSESGILVLQHMDKYEDALHPFEKWVFGRAVRLAMTQAEQQDRFTVFFLDEVRHGPFGRYLMKLATAGRGKGAGMVLGLTDIEGLRDQLNPHRAGEVLGGCSTMVMMMNANPETAEWVSKRAGRQLLSMEKRSVSETSSTDTNAPKASPYRVASIIEDHLKMWDRGPTEPPNKKRELYEKYGIIPHDSPAYLKTSKSTTVQTSMDEVERPAVYDSEVMHMPKAEFFPGKGLVTSALVVSTYLGMFPMVTSQMDHENVGFKPGPAAKYPNVERPAHEFRFDGWTPDDEKRLNLPPVPPDAPLPNLDDEED